MGQKRLDHHRQFLLLRHQFQQGAKSWSLATGAHHALTGSPPEGFEYHLAMVGGEVTQQLNITGHQGGSHEFRELQSAELFIPGPQA